LRPTSPSVCSSRAGPATYAPSAPPPWAASLGESPRRGGRAPALRAGSRSRRARALRASAQDLLARRCLGADGVDEAARVSRVDRSRGIPNSPGHGPLRGVPGLRHRDSAPGAPRRARSRVARPARLGGSPRRGGPGSGAAGRVAISARPRPPRLRPGFRARCPSPRAFPGRPPGAPRRIASPRRPGLRRCGRCGSGRDGLERDPVRPEPSTLARPRRACGSGQAKSKGGMGGAGAPVALTSAKPSASGSRSCRSRAPGSSPAAPPCGRRGWG
jgi:hypothetical protein